MCLTGVKFLIFGKSILDYSYKIQRENMTNLNLLGGLSLESLSDRSMYSLFFNNHLKDEENYEKLRTRLGLSNITFTYSNAVDLPQLFSRSHDFKKRNNCQK